MKRGFTFVEMLIAIVTASIIAGAAMMFMSRGASNVARGSFHVMVANQAAWIVSLLRADVTRSGSIEFEPGSDGENWTGDSTFEIVVPDPVSLNKKLKAAYSVEEGAKTMTFVRECDGKKHRVISELLKSIQIKKEDGSFIVNMHFEDNTKKDGLPVDWAARIYLPVPNSRDAYWLPLHSSAGE